jgi:ATP-dependent Clp protease adaptor protein ClpS
MPDVWYDEAPVAENEEKIEEPLLYRVILHNDDYTTQDFVVWLLMTVFHMALPTALDVMLNVHQRGAGIAGIYTYEIAEMKMSKTNALAREREFPLLCTMEPD